MRMQTGVALFIFAIAALTSVATYAWNLQQDNGNSKLIRCSDGSNSTVVYTNGSWTVSSAGNNGKTGGQFAIYGQAALYGCGE